MTETTDYHVPVLLAESIDGLDIKADGIYVDVTFGGGGHSREILKQLTSGHLYAFDQDSDAWANEIESENFTLIKHNFRYIKNFLRYYNINSVDGVLADLGVSSHHFDEPERGFSYRFDSALDMRMNRDAQKNAADFVNTADKDEMLSVFRNYGEIDNAWKLVNLILDYRKNKTYRTTGEFIESIKTATPRNRENKYYSQVFQALRIYVNNELDVLKELLQSVTTLLKPNGRFAVITYHSLEDRLVKNFFKSGNFDGRIEKDFYGNIISPLDVVNRKIIIPSDEEIERNTRARSAKLRIACKKTI